MFCRSALDEQEMVSLEIDISKKNGRASMKVCQGCGSKLAVKNEERVHYLESGLDNIYLDGIIQYECLECGNNHAEIPAVKDLNFLITINLVFKKGELTCPPKTDPVLKLGLGYNEG